MLCSHIPELTTSNFKISVISHFFHKDQHISKKKQKNKQRLLTLQPQFIHSQFMTISFPQLSAVKIEHYFLFMLSLKFIFCFTFCFFFCVRYVFFKYFFYCSFVFFFVFFSFCCCCLCVFLIVSFFVL